MGVRGQQPFGVLNLLHCTEWHYPEVYADTTPPSDMLTKLPIRVSAARFARDGQLEAPLEWDVRLGWDDFGNLLWQEHTSLSRPGDAMYVQTAWLSVGDTPEKKDSHWVPHTITTATASDLTEIDEHISYAYDDEAYGTPPLGAGLLTHEKVCADIGTCSEELSWAFDRGTRGQVTEITQVMPAPLTDRVQQFPSHGFGATVALSEQNALGHTTSHVIDELGRVIETTDANGVKTYVTYDALGRAIKEEIQGVGGVRLTKIERDYLDGVLPRQVVTRHYRDNVHMASSRDLVDGFGRARQHWEPFGTGQGWIVSATEHDARGIQRWASKPHHETSTPIYTNVAGVARLAYQSTRGETASWSVHDVMGDPVTTWLASAGQVTHSEPLPGVLSTTDAEGYVKELHHDTHGRLVEVREGSALVLPSPTGKYDYDTRGRIVRFEDGAGNQWFYTYDGAGRLQVVERALPGVSQANASSYYAYRWVGTEPAEQFEGALGTTGTGDVQWSYDLLGRIVQKEVRDADPANPAQLYQWTWDTSSTGAVWRGAAHEVVDPAGTVAMTFGSDPVYGSLGYITETQRTFTGVAPHKVVTVTSNYDEDGRVLSTTLPSGAVVSSGYHDTGALAWNALDHTGDNVSATVTYEYDDHGLPQGWLMGFVDNTGPSPVTHDWSELVTRATDTMLVDAMLWDGPAALPGDPGEHYLTYDYFGNGDLFCKDPHVADHRICYTYDHWHRINGVHEGDPMLFPPGLAAYESYVYDAASNPTQMTRAGVTWTYAAATGFNEFPSRSAPGVNETFSHHDPASGGPELGRLRTWATMDSNPGGVSVDRQFAYDGEGRLGRMQRQEAGMPASTTVYRYTSDNELAHERRTGLGAGDTFRFGVWQEKHGLAIESVLPMLRRVGTEYRVVLTEADGRAIWTADVAATQETQEVVGAYNSQSRHLVGRPTVYCMCPEANRFRCEAASMARLRPSAVKAFLDSTGISSHMWRATLRRTCEPQAPNTLRWTSTMCPAPRAVAADAMAYYLECSPSARNCGFGVLTVLTRHTPDCLTHDTSLQRFVDHLGPVLSARR